MESRQVVANDLDRQKQRLDGPLQLLQVMGSNPANSFLVGSASLQREVISAHHLGLLLESERLGQTAEMVRNVERYPYLGRVAAVTENWRLVERAAYERQQGVQALVDAQDAQTLGVQVMGGLTVLESIPEFALATALWFTPEVTSKVLASYVTYRASDHLFTGTMQILMGQQRGTVTANLAQSVAKELGANDATARQSGYNADLAADALTGISGLRLYVIPGRPSVVGGPEFGQTGTAAPSGGAAATGPFDEAGILRTRGGERIVIPQGPNPTCGPISAAMVAQGEGAFVIPENFVVIARQKGWLTEKGMFRSDLPNLLWEARIASHEVTGASLEQLAAATAKGKPTIVRLNGNPAHFIIVDGVTTRMGQPVVAIRNPHGQKYFQLTSEFEKQWDKSMIVVEGMK
jgi:hypothetical protein